MAIPKSIYDKYKSAMARSLAEDGYELIRKAFEGSDYSHNKTQNLHDSYGSAVYYNGKLVEGSKRFMTSFAVGGKYNTYTNELEYGRSEIDSFFDNYKAKSKGFELVLAAAIFYAPILEEGRGGIKRKYRVISFIADNVDAVARKYGGKVNRIKEGRRV